MQKTKKFRRLLAGGVAVLMLGVSVPVAAFATGDGTAASTVSAQTNETVTVNIQFKCGEEVVKGGDFTVPAGVQNYSVLEQYVPEGYKIGRAHV